MIWLPAETSWLGFAPMYFQCAVPSVMLVPVPVGPPLDADVPP
ncbi:MAG TPA: hypothetical protein VFT22_07295 [Kofleriaceae bacterium]|nr:hypothetical protein [Kofleriaceae bacterium]